MKTDPSGKKWQERYFSLRERVVEYSLRRGSHPRGTFSVGSDTLMSFGVGEGVATPPSPFAFTVTTTERAWGLCAHSEKDLSLWFNALHRLTRGQVKVPSSCISSESPGAGQTAVHGLPKICEKAEMSALTSRAMVGLPSLSLDQIASLLLRWAPEAANEVASDAEKGLPRRVERWTLEESRFVAEAFTVLPLWFAPIQFKETLAFAASSAAGTCASELVWYWLATGLFAELDLADRRILLHPENPATQRCALEEIVRGSRQDTEMVDSTRAPRLETLLRNEREAARAAKPLALRNRWLASVQHREGVAQNGPPIPWELSLRLRGRREATAWVAGSLDIFRGLPSSQLWDVLGVPAEVETLADAWTLLNDAAFKSLRAIELAAMARGPSKPQHVATGSVRAVINRFDGQAYLVASQVLQCVIGGSLKRTSHWFVELARALRKRRDYEGCGAIVAGLHLHAVNEIVHSALTDEDAATLAEIADFLRPVVSERSPYREELQRRAVCVPQLAIHLGCLSRAFETASNESDRVCWTCVRAVSDELFTIQRLQQRSRRDMTSSPTLLRVLEKSISAWASRLQCDESRHACEVELEELAHEARRTNDL